MRDRKGRTPCAVVLSNAGAGLYLRVVTIPHRGGVITPGSPLHTWALRGQIRRDAMRPDEAAEALWETADIDPLDGRSIERLEALVRSSVAVHEVRGMPGLCELTEGQPEGRPVKRRRLSCDAGVRVARERERRGAGVMVADAVADVARMAAAQDVLDPELLLPQRRAVAAHLATRYGLLNASQVGTGKTIQTLRSQRMKASAEPGFRALIAALSSLREQWADEIAEWFPEAKVLLPEGTRIARELVRFERTCGDAPGLVVVGHEQAREHVGELEVLTYSELVVDDPPSANPTQLWRALWRLRKRAAVGVVLFGTPYGRELGDLDALIAWARDDERAARERRMGAAFGSFDTLSRQRFHDAAGPVMQRVRRAELREHIPDIGEPETVRLSPGPALSELLVAAEGRIAELYGEVKARVETAAKSGSKLGKEAQRELSRMRGVLLGGVTVARLCKDPEAVRQSEAQVAQLLEAEGLVGAAIEEGSPSRQVVAQTIAEAVADGEQVLCFSEFSSHLRLLAGELADVHGVDPALYVGGLAKGAGDEIKRRFRSGEVRCALVGPVGQKGHNLQPQSPEPVVVHYDLVRREGARKEVLY